MEINWSLYFRLYAGGTIWCLNGPDTSTLTCAGKLLTQMLFDSHHPLEDKLSVIRTLHYRAEGVHTKREGQEKEQEYIK